MKHCVFLLKYILLFPLAVSNDQRKQLLYQDRDYDSCSLNHTCLNESGEDEESTCPVWFLCNVNNTCQCGPTLPGIIECDQEKLTAVVMDYFCVTTQEGTNDTIVGACFTNSGRTLLTEYGHAGGAQPLPKNKSRLNSDMCGHLYRDGALCGKCMEGYYPMVYSYNQSCMRCENYGQRNWWLYITVAFLPLTFFYFIVLFFKMNLTSSSHLHGYVFFSQSISMLPSAQLLVAVTATLPTKLGAVKVFLTFWGIWNLDFFRAYTSVCLKLGTLHVLALDYIVAVYPVLLTLLSYLFIELHDRNFRLVVFIWKPFRQILMLFRHNWDSRNSIINVYSAFFYLSYLKCLSVSAYLLIPTKIYHLGSKTSYVLYYDATKPYFGKDHLPFAIIALIALTIFNILPVVILLLYQFSWFQRILHHLPIKHHILNSFVDTFQGCYKDGTEPGTRDCRWFSAMFLVLWLGGYGISGAAPNALFFVFVCISLSVFVMMMVTIQPFKTELAYYTPVHAIFILSLIILNTTSAGFNITTVKSYHYSNFCSVINGFVASMAVVYLSVYAIHWLFTKWRFGLDIITRIRLLRQGYERLDAGEIGKKRADSLPDRLKNSHLYHHRNMANFNNTVITVNHCCPHVHNN